MAEGADGGAVLKDRWSRAEGPAWSRSWWRPCLVEDVCRGNVFLEWRRAGRGAVNLEDDLTLPTRILLSHLLLRPVFVPDQDSGELMEEPRLKTLTLPSRIPLHLHLILQKTC
ncbi:unnamed protein product [Boreogadus saida]